MIAACHPWKFIVRCNEQIAEGALRFLRKKLYARTRKHPEIKQTNLRKVYTNCLFIYVFLSFENCSFFSFFFFLIIKTSRVNASAVGENPKREISRVKERRSEKYSDTPRTFARIRTRICIIYQI